MAEREAQKKMPRLSPRLEEKLAQLPALAGVYLMKNSQGEIIYVGKAENLKNRVRSYFQEAGHSDAKTAALVKKIWDFETIVVDHPRQALILESNLIKEYAPHYNVRLRDDKHYPYLRLTMEEDYPRLIIARRAEKDGSRYFGPYVDSRAMHQAADLIKRLFPLRSCTGKSWPAHHRACLNAHIGLCPAPCEGKISQEEYQETARQVELLLEGKTREIQNRLTKEMEAASADLRFEDAARCRDMLKALEEIRQKQQMEEGGSREHYDLLGCRIKEGQGVIQVFFVRGGKVVGREPFFLINGEEGREDEALARFLLDYYAPASHIPPRLYLSHGAENMPELAALLGEKAGRKVELIVPQRGDKRRLMRLVENNAALVLQQYLDSRERRAGEAAAALEDLRQTLGLKRSPSRIECYDISHIQGSYTVGAMVVFNQGLPAPKLYRRFRIKTVAGVDDYSSLKEMLARRWQRGLKEKETGKNPPDFALFPDLLVIDGGKGQLSAVMQVLEPLGLQGAALIALAEEEERIFRPGDSQGLLLPKDAPGLRLLQRIRDEAHRFALSYHRRLRGKGQTHSQLEDIPGVGPVLRRRLLAAFGSPAVMAKASAEEFLQVPGISRKTGQAIYAHFHPDEQKP